MRETEKRVNAKAVAVGIVVYLIGVLVAALTGVLFVAMAAYSAAQRGATQQQISAQVWRELATPGFSLICFGVAVIFTALGGYVAARMAKRALLIHSLPVGLLSLFTGILFMLLAPMPVPTWFLPVALVLPVPLAIAGGYLGSLGWSPLPIYPDDEDGAEVDFDEGEAFRREQFEQMMLKNLKRQQQQSQSVGQLVQQRREQELEQQQETVRERKQEALSQAMEQAKVEACEDMREIVRAAFMSHPAATEEDFERCWPGIRDEMFRQYALETYNSRLAHNQGNA